MMRGGEMDPSPLASLDPSFAAALENMKPGQISEVVESQFGFHIIQLLDKRGQLYHSATSCCARSTRPRSWASRSTCWTASPT